MQNITILKIEDDIYGGLTCLFDRIFYFVTPSTAKVVPIQDLIAPLADLER